MWILDEGTSDCSRISTEVATVDGSICFIWHRSYARCASWCKPANYPCLGPVMCQKVIICHKVIPNVSGVYYLIYLLTFQNRLYLAWLIKALYIKWRNDLFFKYLWLRLVVPTIVIYIIINWVLYGHLKYLYRTVLLYSFKLLLSSWHASEKDIFNVNDNVYMINVTLLRTDYSLNIVKGIYVLAHNGI